MSKTHSSKTKQEDATSEVARMTEAIRRQRVMEQAAAGPPVFGPNGTLV